jgi:hypothetical protein
LGLGAPRERPADKPLSTLVWEGVSAEEVVDDFLSRFKVPNDADKVRIPLIRAYIQDCFRDGELTDWTVALISSSLKEAPPRQFAGHSIGLIKRQHIGQELRQDDEAIRYTIRRLVSPPDEMIDMSETELAEAREDTLKVWQSDPVRFGDRNKAPSVPGGVHIRAHRPAKRGLLMIYPLDPEQSKGDVIPIGFALSFPGSSRTGRLKYRVNNVYFAQEYGAGE